MATYIVGVSTYMAIYMGNVHGNMATCMVIVHGQVNMHGHMPFMAIGLVMHVNIHVMRTDPQTAAARPSERS